MKHALFSLAILAAACAPEAETLEPLAELAQPQNDIAGNRMEPLLPNGADAFCSADGAWCVINVGNAARVMHTVDGQASAVGEIAFEEGQERAIWRWIVREPRAEGEAVMVGVAATQMQGYSGGGASATHLTLYAVSDVAPAPVLTVPLAAEVNIRACFDEDDIAARREACSDDYSFGAEFSLDETVSSGAPRFVLATQASTYPGVRARNEDSTTQSPLTQADLVIAPDPACSYRRVYSRGPDGLYSPETPTPDCSQYLEP